jgi:very-short-patch-repair endonuclease
LVTRPAFLRLQIPSATSGWPYYFDFFCEEARLSIEVDGFGHGLPEQQRHDAERKVYLTSLGIQELRFWNSYLRRNAQSIRDTIFRELQERAPHSLSDYTRPIKSVDKRKVS